MKIVQTLYGYSKLYSNFSDTKKLLDFREMKVKNMSWARNKPTKFNLFHRDALSNFTGKSNPCSIMSLVSTHYWKTFSEIQKSHLIGNKNTVEMQCPLFVGRSHLEFFQIKLKRYLGSSRCQTKLRNKLLITTESTLAATLWQTC